MPFKAMGPVIMPHRV